MAPIARGIADSFRVLEPFQSSISATVADHVADLHEVVESYARDTAPALVGHSWGAMLALAYAAAHPSSAGPIALVCSGTFDLAAREQFSINLSERKKDEGARRRFELALQIADPNERFHELGKQTLDFLQRLAMSPSPAYNVRGLSASQQSVLVMVARELAVFWD